jgi:hypothetical protein
MQKKKWLRTSLLKVPWSELGMSLTKAYWKEWDVFVKDVIVIFIKKLISTVILVFLNFYFVINKKIGVFSAEEIKPA